MPTSEYEVAAYYFPNYHPDPRNDGWHGAGWTEWELVKAARPRYAGHRQPVVPAWGYFDESDPLWAEREIDLAADHGITSFLYDWYWYEDGPFLQDGLDKGFLGASNSNRLKFALMWANHEWLNIHPSNFRNKPEKLVSGRISRRAFDAMTDHIVENYFSRPNYLTIDDRPYFCVYELASFIDAMGGMSQACEALNRLRDVTRDAGFPDVHLNATIWGVKVLPNEIGLERPAQVLDYMGFSSVTSYAWVHHFDPNSVGFPVSSYREAARANYATWEANQDLFSIPYHPNVSMGWDSSPRTVGTDRYEPRGYPWLSVLDGNTPEAFRAALVKAKQFVDRPDVCAKSGGLKMVTLNAWNEWTEGSYLLPDTVTGTQYLEAIRDVFAASRSLVEAR
ncbi:MAG: glycoside hydrolase family 99-like domain-containing protein [Capsulimonadaceae bacterium]|nr:glycoside hydrolase family 99-like domain-containing protein [Capsulimonadaceae bacterium]